jgi:hypothetical protein
VDGIAVAIGIGLTVMTTFIGFPIQVPEVGVIEYTAVPGIIPVVVKVCAIVSLLPLEAPITPVWLTIQAKVVPGIELVRITEVVSPEQIVRATGLAVAIGAGPIVTGFVAVTAAHPPLAIIVLVIVYIPGVLVAKSISPVLTFTNIKPGGKAENVPALAPVAKVGKGLLPY